MPPFSPARPGRHLARLGIAVAAFSLAAPAFTADAPAPDLALSFKPAQKGIEIDTPEKADFGKCTVKVERGAGKSSGWVVLGPQGQILRRFIDTNGDNVVDQWRYYQNGLEVYRDLDTNANNKIDQSRWMNLGGTRWGLDANEDGKIDAWKVLSAEEASRVAVEAMVAGDADVLASVLVTGDDLKGLGINEELTKQVLESVAKPAEQAKAAAKESKLLAKGTNWLRFDSSSPGLIPADEGKAGKDLLVYENAMAIVDAGGGQAGLIAIGEMVRVGDVWKLTQVPKPIEGNAVQINPGGILMQPPAVAPGGAPEGISPKMREYLEALQKLDGDAPKPSDGAEAFGRYNAQRAKILRGLVDASTTPEDREMWTRQFADSVSAAVQMGIYPEGLKDLESLERQLAEDKADVALRGYVTYRRLIADYNQRARSADAEGRADVQKWWLGQLNAFVTNFGSTPDAAEALLQLALAEEFNANLDEAGKWYERIAKEHADLPQGQLAVGALRRLGLKGKPFALTGTALGGKKKLSADDYRGKLLLVLFWSTGCVPCEQDLPLLQALYKEYKDQGFEILGVNLDPTAEPVGPYVTSHKIDWPQIHEPGGQESPPARQYGVVLQPTMIVVGKDGKVISRGTSVEDLKAALPELLKK